VPPRAARGNRRKGRPTTTFLASADIVLILEMITMIDAPGPGGGAPLRRRYLDLVLQALRAPGAGPLPGPAAQPADLAARWRTRPA
jgi:hypothetical protein